MTNSEENSAEQSSPLLEGNPEYEHVDDADACKISHSLWILRPSEKI